MKMGSEADVRAMLKDISDIRLIKIVADAEDWPLEKVYRMAHTQVHVEGYPWDTFVKTAGIETSGKLPGPVRQELVRAFQIHMDAGTLKMPMTSGLLRDVGKWFIIGWVIYFILLIFF